MDTKRLIAMMLLSFAVIFGWQVFVAQLYEKHPEWKRPGQQAATTQPTDAAATRPVAGASTQSVITSVPTTTKLLRGSRSRGWPTEPTLITAFSSVTSKR